MSVLAFQSLMGYFPIDYFILRYRAFSNTLYFKEGIFFSSVAKKNE